MDESFDIPSLAAHLKRSPAEIRKLAERGQLPGRRVGGDWRFERAEVFHWMEVHIGEADGTALQHIEEALAHPADQASGGVASLMDPALVWLDFPARTRHAVITDLCHAAADAGWLWDPAGFAAAIQARESMHPTALDNGVALLHPRRPQPGLFSEPFLGFARTPRGLPFGGPRGVLTDVFFLIASANEASHLRLLARLSRLIAIPDYLAGLRAALSARELLELTESCEQRLDGPETTRAR